jgi:GDPmannose 4,6-dehydratase
VSGALVLGAAGQDGVLLARLLRSSGMQVYGLVRAHGEASQRLTAMAPGIEILLGDITDRARLEDVFVQTCPDYVYNLAALSSVARSWSTVERVMEVNTIGVVNVLEAIRTFAAKCGTSPRFCQASSSEMFGLPEQSPQNEQSGFHPRSPYGVSKLAAHHLTVNYRESYGLFACSGILFNHESPLRELHFVTRKITHGVAAIKLGLATELVLGNLDIQRDWGHARDYVAAMRLMIEHHRPDDYVVATGQSRSLREFLSTAFDVAGVPAWEQYVRSDPALLRPVEVAGLVGDAGKARRELGWTIEYSFDDMVAEMVVADLRRLAQARN